MTERAVVSRHGNLLRWRSSTKRSYELLNRLLLQEGVIDGVKHERRVSRNVLQRGKKGTKLPFLPARIQHDFGILRRGGANQIRVAPQDDNGLT